MKNADFRDVAQCGSVNTDVSEERVAFIFRVEIISQLGTLPVTST
jgi:hypothetical protein